MTSTLGRLSGHIDSHAPTRRDGNEQSSSGQAASTGVTTASQPDEHLKTGVLRLPGVLMQSVTGIAPAIAGLFTVQFIAINAGLTAPLAYFGAFIIALMLGYVLAQFTRHLSSTGGYYTFVSRSLGGRAGKLALAGAAMGEANEQAIEERYLAKDQLPPPDLER